jgi:hypothetical protein
MHGALRRGDVADQRFEERAVFEHLDRVAGERHAKRYP